MSVQKRQIDVTTAPGRLAFGSVTGSYVTLLALPARTRQAYITNSLDKELVISLNGGTNDWLYLPASTSIVIDPSAFAEGGGGLTVSVKHNGVAPTSGAISCGVLKEKL